jgi:exopolysaccharide biosynthesis polyprenyl glycosylphosphotransferase
VSGTDASDVVNEPAVGIPLVRSRTRGLRRGARSAQPPALGCEPGADLSPVWEVGPQSGQGQVPGLSTIQRRYARSRRALAISDVIACFLALEMALLLFAGPARGLRWEAVVLAPFVVLLSKAFGLYDHEQHRLNQTTLDEAPALVGLAVTFALGIWIAEGFALDGPASRGQVIALMGFGWLALTLGRTASRAVLLRLSAPEQCLFVGNVGIASHTSAKLAEAPSIRAHVVGRVSLNEFEQLGSLPLLGDHTALRDVIERHAIERVIIAPDGHDQDAIVHCIRLVKALGLNVSVLPRLLDVVGSSSVFDNVQGTTLLGVRQYGLTKSSEVLKRSTDLVGAAIMLVLLAPLCAVITVAIAIDSPGSPFFSQPRVGRRGERFRMLKFRTMVPHAERLKGVYRSLNEVEGGLFKISDDPRITRVGRFLRRTSLDELPQLINVLRGEMSLVGPRPLVLDEDELIEGWERRRLAVKPGMTGLWQIFGSSRIPLPEMVKIDYVYGANWSIWLDLKILLRTVPYVLARRGL